ncbi:MAG: Spy/CpxP family protein refolding chaperone [Desulfobacteraceae bacterium]|jgi:Spy/CpxP family protein refolding chaperone
MRKLMLSLVLTVVLAVPAFSQMMNMNHMGDMGGLCIEHADILGLTDGQVAKMKPLHYEMQKNMARFNADLKIAEIEHMEIMDVKNFDMDKAHASVEKMEGLKKSHQMAMLVTMKDMRTLLTDDQFKKMNKMMPMKPVGKPGREKHTKKKRMQKH